MNNTKGEKTWNEQSKEVIIASFGPLGERGISYLLEKLGTTYPNVPMSCIETGNDIRSKVKGDLLKQSNKNETIRKLKKSLKLLLDIIGYKQSDYISKLKRLYISNIDEFLSFVNNINQKIINEFSSSTEEIQRKKHILSKYYLEDKPLREIAEEMGDISYQRVSSIINSCLK